MTHILQQINFAFAESIFCCAGQNVRCANSLSDEMADRNIQYATIVGENLIFNGFSVFLLYLKHNF